MSTRTDKLSPVTDALQLIAAPIQALLGQQGGDAIVAPMLEGLSTAGPFVALVEEQALAAEARRDIARQGAEHHQERAARLESALADAVEVEAQYWQVIASELAGYAPDDEAGPDQLAAVLGVDGPAASEAEFDAFMADADAPLVLGLAQQQKIDPHEQALQNVARRVRSPPRDPEATAKMLAATGDPSLLAAQSGVGLCLHSAGNDYVTIGNGTAVCSQNGEYQLVRLAELVCELEGARVLRASRWASGLPPVLVPPARAALAACRQVRGATAPTADRLGAELMVGAQLSSTSGRTKDLIRLRDLLLKARKARKNKNALAAVYLRAAYEIFRVVISPGELVASDALEARCELIDVGRVRWDRLGALPVFWLPLCGKDPDQVGGPDTPWTRDIPAPAARWQAQSPTMSLDPGWHARVVVVPDDPNLWCIDPGGQWWSLEANYDNIVDARRAHVDGWLRSLEDLEAEVPPQIAALSARSAAADQPRTEGGSQPQIEGEAAGLKQAPRFSREWIEERAQRYAYEDDSAARAAGARAAERGCYTRADFLTVVRWKSARALPKAEGNTDGAIRAATHAAFSASNELARITALTALPGVGVPVASTLLHFAFPDEYTILDWRVLQSLGDRRRRTQYSAEEWCDYLERCRELATKARVSMRDLDKALWQDSVDADAG